MTSRSRHGVRLMRYDDVPSRNNLRVTVTSVYWAKSMAGGLSARKVSTSLLASPTVASTRTGADPTLSVPASTPSGTSSALSEVAAATSTSTSTSSSTSTSTSAIEGSVPSTSGAPGSVPCSGAIWASTDTARGSPSLARSPARSPVSAAGATISSAASSPSSVSGSASGSTLLSWLSASSRVSDEKPTSSNVSETSAIEAGPRDSEPAKMTSSIALPRRCLADCSPMHQRIASTILDLPHPFGPTTAVIASSIETTARSLNDLNPMISIRLMRIRFPLVALHVWQCSAYATHNTGPISPSRAAQCKSDMTSSRIGTPKSARYPRCAI